MPSDLEKHRTILTDSLERAQSASLANAPPQAEEAFQNACEIVFASKTQAYREVLAGCLLTRITDRNKNIRLPYVSLAGNAFNGRQLDEKVINPFLRDANIPCSRGPYLSVFRRKARFDESNTERVKDKEGYEAFLRSLTIIEGMEDTEALSRLLDHVLYRFVLLREESKVELICLERISLNQYEQIISDLLQEKTGGLFAVLLVLSTVETIISRFSLAWEVDYQGINVADMASGVGGDITIKDDGDPLLTIEVTERPVDASRVKATFKDKIAPLTLSDYVFLVHFDRIPGEGKQQAEKYFAQGYDVNFVDIHDWIINTLVTVGVEGRKHFQEALITHLSQDEISKTVKVAWNAAVEKISSL